MDINMRAGSYASRVAEVRALVSRALAGVAVCLALASCSKPPRVDDAQGPPCPGCNVILISIDTVRADHVGTYGYAQRSTTPNLDAFASEAAVFEHAVSQAAWTLPAHASMMTGLYPGRLGLTRYPAKRTLPDNAPTLAEVMQRAGYTTAGFTGGGFVSRHFGFDRGFDIYASDGRRFEHNIDQALTWLVHNDHRRFFLFLHGYDAHRPYFSYPQDKQALGVRGVRAQQGGFCLSEARVRPGKHKLEELIGYYDASIHMADRFVGRVIDVVRERGLTGNTVILVTSDHGEEFFDHGNCDHVRFLYQEIIRVPYLLRVPGVTTPGLRIPDVVPASISVARTLLDLVGVEHAMPGVSLVPFLEGKRGLFGAVFSEADSALGVKGSRGSTIAMTRDRDKLISYLEEGSDEGYDLADDPRETMVLPESRDIYAQRPTLRAWHQTMTVLPRNARRPRARDEAAATQPKRAATDHREPEPGDKPSVPPEVEKQLRSLGYVD